MALIYVKDFPHMADSLKTKKESFLAKEITSPHKHYWLCKCEYEDEDGEISECGKQWNESIESRFHYLHCPDCEERFDVPTDKCMFGGTLRSLCSMENCRYCLFRSFASIDYQYLWDTEKNEKTSRDIFINSNKKYHFKCDSCNHEFMAVLAALIKYKEPCPFCASTPKRLCGKESCKMCFNNSFASHEYARLWNYDKNELKPWQIFKGTHTKYWFICEDCDHDLYVSINHLVNDRQCSYCSNRKLCDDYDCPTCFEKSFASDPKSEYWDYDKNEGKPRDYFKGCDRKYSFTCPECNHSILKSPLEIKQGRWCGYCNSKLICLSDKCTYCYEKSFASHPKAIYFLEEENGISARELFKGCNVRYWFKCPFGHPNFKRCIYDVSKNKTWCNLCTNKTEAYTIEILEKVHSNIISQARFPWCTFSNGDRMYAFDIYLPDVKTICEIDGDLHFRNVEFFSNDHDSIRKRDLHKMKCAIDNGISVIRIPQMDIYNNRDNWLDKLKANLILRDVPEIIYISKDIDKYNKYKEDYEKLCKGE